jgi:hypothetical protein
MSMPFHLQRLPPEALDVLRYLSKNGPASAYDLETKTDLSTRLIGKAIRRLVNFDYIELRSGVYQLTSDGNIAAQDLSAFEGNAPQSNQPVREVSKKVQRHLSVVMPRLFGVGQPANLFIGVNPPEQTDERLSNDVQLELRVSAIGGTLDPATVSINVPPDRAASPGKFALIPADNVQMVRVRIDAFQSIDNHALEPLGGVYFDVRISSGGIKQDSTLRAVGMDVWLQNT